MYYSEKILEEVRAGNDIGVCETAEKGRSLLGPLSFPQ